MARAVYTIGQRRVNIMGRTINTTSGHKPKQQADKWECVPSDIDITKFHSGRAYGTDDEAAKRLAVSIIDNKQLQPVGCRSNESKQLELIWGFTRHRAIELIRSGFTAEDGRLLHIPDFKIECLVFDCTEAEAAIMTILENSMREDTSHIDNAHTVRRLQLEHKMSNRQIAGHLNKQESYISRVVKLLNLPEAQQQQVHSGDLAMSAALALLDAPKEVTEVVTASGGKVTESVITTAVREALLNGSTCALIDEPSPDVEDVQRLVGLPPDMVSNPPTVAQKETKKQADKKAATPPAPTQKKVSKLRALTMTEFRTGLTAIRCSHPTTEALINYIEEFIDGKHDALAFGDLLARNIKEY